MGAAVPGQSVTAERKEGKPSWSQLAPLPTQCLGRSGGRRVCNGERAEGKAGKVVSQPVVWIPRASCGGHKNGSKDVRVLNPRTCHEPRSLVWQEGL